MKKRKLLMILALMIGLCLSGCSGSAQEAQKPQETAGVEINVFAAASLTDCLNEIIEAYQANSAHKVVAVYEASGTLRDQIEAGADCDLFISANQKNMDQLQEAGEVAEDSRKDLLGNQLTMIASANRAATMTEVADLLQEEVVHIAIGEPSEVPAGQYAQEALENMGLWNELQDKFVMAKNVRAVLTYVDGGDADCGFVYRTDAMELTKGVIVCDVPADQYTPVTYPAALMKEAPQPEAAADFFAYLGSDAAKTVFEKYGFTVLS